MTDAEKREKVILGLESCSGKAIFEAKCPFNCPYAVSTGKTWTEPDCCEQLIKDALALLKEQEPRVMTLEEIRERAETGDPDPVFVERKSGSTAWDLYTIDIVYHMAKRSYMDIRAWTSRPSPEQMRETPWEGDEDET